MLRRILVPLDPTPFAKAALHWSCYAAKVTGAEITGLAVLDLHEIERSVGSAPAGGIYYARHLVEKKQQESLEHIEALIRSFEITCKQEGVKYRIAERQGNPSDQVIKDSVFFDLVVIGLKTCFHFECSDRPGKSVAHVIDHTVTPILAVPDRFVEPKGKLNTLIAFNGTLPSVAAMHRFAQLEKTADFRVTILMSNPDRDYANIMLDGAERFLHAHDYADIKKVWTPRNIVEEVRENYLEDSNMIVFGAHSKRRWLPELMVGSLSKALITYENKYLLIGQ